MPKERSVISSAFQEASSVKKGCKVPVYLLCARHRKPTQVSKAESEVGQGGALKNDGGRDWRWEPPRLLGRGAAWSDLFWKNWLLALILVLSHNIAWQLFLEQGIAPEHFQTLVFLQCLFHLKLWKFLHLSHTYLWLQKKTKSKVGFFCPW